MPTINGTSNADRLFGSPQNDTLSGSTGADVLRGGAGNDVYVVDNAGDVVDETNFVMSNTTSVTQVDLGSAAAHRAIDLGDISPDGTKIVFASYARLAGTDVSDSGHDIYVKDLISGTITHVNVRSSGAQASPLSQTYRAMFLDNNDVAFVSADTTMMAGVTDTNGTFDIFIKNLITGELTLVTNAAGSSTTTANGASALASVSLDGSKILFTSLATNLGPTDTNGFQDLYMKDINTGVVTLVSQLSTGVQADNESTRTGFGGRVLAKFVGNDNTKVLFSSKATNLVTPDDNNAGATGTNILGNDLFIKDLVTGTITRVNTGSAGQQANYNIRIGDVSNDGTKVLFVTQASNLIDPLNSTVNTVAQLYVKDLVTGTVTLISTPNGSTLADQESYNPIFTADGTRVIFRTAATNLGAGSTAGSDMLMYDLNTNQLIQLNTTSAGVASDGNTPNSQSLRTVLSPDGSRIYFIDQANNISGTSDTFLDIFYRDLFQVTSGDAGGTDTVQSSIDYTLGSNIENLTLTGSGNINGTGNSANNTIIGNSGNNTITGGDGVDTLTGGAGSDTFVFSNISHSNNASPDVIADFVSGTDKINVTGMSGSAIQYSGTTSGANRLWYAQSGGNTNVMIDTTGDGVADTTIRLTGTLNLAATDFIGIVTNSAPVANPVSVSGGEDAMSISGNASATDADSNPLTYSVSGGTPTGVTFNSNGSFSYTPQAVDQALDAGESRQVTFQYIANDGSASSNTATITITINGANDAPVATDVHILVGEDELSITDGVSATDVDAEALMYSVSGATPSGVVFNSDGTFSYTPQAADQALDSGESRQVTFQYVASDGTALSNAATVTIAIYGANDAPMATDVSVSGSEDAASIDGSVSATDVDVEALMYSVSGATPSGVVFNSDGTFSYTPQAVDQALDDGESRQVTFQYVASDGTAVSNAQTVTITINGANDAPVIVPIAVSGTEDDVTISDSVSATDADDEPLTYSVVGTAPAGLTFDSNGQFSYDLLAADQALDDGESRQVTFQYVANDGTVDSAPQTMTMTIHGVNDAPVTDVVSVSGNANASSITGNVIANDVDGDTLTYATSGSVPAGVTLNSDGSFSYTPQAADLALDDGETRQITFDYVAYDGDLVSNVQMVNIYVTGVNDAPVATDVAVSGSEDDASISGNVSATDVDVEPLSYAISGATPTGVSFNSDGSFSYTPQAIDQALNVGQSRDVTFQYVANDGTVDSAAQTVTITIHGADDATTLSGDIAATVGEGGNPSNAPTSFTGQITINDVDTAGLEMVANSSTGLYGSFSIDQQGQWSYQVDQSLAIVQQLTASDTVQDLFTVQTSNGISQQITITVRGSNVFLDTGNLDQYSGGSQDDIIYGYLGKDTLNGQQGNDSLYGGADQDTLIGGEGNDYLDGGTHIDTLIGGAGNDTYVVNTTLDKITELDNEGIDTVLSSDSYQLSANIENLTLTAGGLTGNGNTSNNIMNAHALGSTLNGGGGNDTLNGNIGNDNLNGGTGSDRMVGGLGDDIYFVNGVGDQVIELAGEGIDTVYTLVNYALSPNVENVILMAADITAFGNVNSNSITASLYGNTLDGGGGDDTLVGRQGNDVLVGGNGKDLMIGAAGNDRYIVNTRGDRVVEFANEGHDTIESSISWTMEDHVEDLILTGTNDSFAKGNTQANVITGNIGNNRLDGAGGLDRLMGGAGNDSYILARGYQQTEVIESGDSLVGGVLDLVEFSAGIYADQVWFAQAGNDLQVSVIGTEANVLIKDWYSTGMGIEQFTLRDGQVLNANEVQQLVDQMAAFTPPPLGQTELTTEQRNALSGVIGSTWDIPS